MKTTLLAAALLACTLAFAADRLNVKTGLWEIVSVTEAAGAPPIPAELRAQLTPEQLAQMQALAGSAMGAAQTHTIKECVTDEDLDKPFQELEGEKCAATIVEGSSTHQEVHLTCSGKHPSAGKMNINTPTPETMNGTIEMQLLDADAPLTIKSEVKGRWLSASCKGEDEAN